MRWGFGRADSRPRILLQEPRRLPPLPASAPWAASTSRLRPPACRRAGRRSPSTDSLPNVSDRARAAGLTALNRMAVPPREQLVLPAANFSACKAPQGTAARLPTASSRRMEPGAHGAEPERQVAGDGEGGAEAALDVGTRQHVWRARTCRNW
jgi:hypothetical protein